MATQNTIPYVITGGLGHFTVEGDVKFLLTDGFLASDDGGHTLRTVITERSMHTGRDVKRARVGHEPTLTDSVVITELDASAPVVLPVRYPSDVYTVTFGDVVPTGDPAPGALTPSAITQTFAGFTIELAEAPGLGASVQVPWTVTP